MAKNKYISTNYGNPITEEMKESAKKIQDICFNQLKIVSEVIVEYMQNVLEIPTNEIDVKSDGTMKHRIKFLRETPISSELVITFDYTFNFDKNTEIGFEFDLKSYNDYPIDSEYVNKGVNVKNGLQ